MGCPISGLLIIKSEAIVYNPLMKRVLIRLLSVFITLFVLSLMVFLMIEGSLGDSSSLLLSEDAGEREIELYSQMRESGPFFVRYLSFLASFFSFDLGYSANGLLIAPMILSALRITLFISFSSVLISLVISLLWSLFASVRDGFSYRALEAFSIFISSLPSFVISLFLILVFSLKLRWFPTSGYVRIGDSFLGFLGSLFLPILVLALMHMSLMLRVFRSSFRSNLGSSYSLVLRSEGAKGVRLSFLTSFRESIPLIASLSADSLASSFSGSAVVESIFALPGVGSLLVSASLSRDFRLTGSILMVVAFLSSIFYLLSEFVAFLSDPRERRAR